MDSLRHSSLPSRLSAAGCVSGARTTANFGLLAGAALAISACTTVDEAALAVFASHAPAAVVVAGRLMQGTASFTRAREGTLHVQSADAPGLACFGEMRLTATSAGVASLSCSDGQAVSIPFQVLSPLRGTGRAQAGNTHYALTYGLAPDMAAAYLGVPVGRMLPAP